MDLFEGINPDNKTLNNEIVPKFSVTLNDAIDILQKFRNLIFKNDTEWCEFMDITGMRKVDAKLNVVEYPKSLMTQRRAFKQERNAISRDPKIDENEKKARIEIINEKEHAFGKKHFDVIVRKITLTNQYGLPIENQTSIGQIDFSNISGWFNQDLFYTINQKTRQYEPNELGKKININYSRGGGSAFREFFYTEENKQAIIEKFKENGYKTFDIDNPVTLESIIQKYVDDKKNNQDSPLVHYLESNVPQFKKTTIELPNTHIPKSGMSFLEVDTFLEQASIYNLPESIVKTISAEVKKNNQDYAKNAIYASAHNATELIISKAQRILSQEMGVFEFKPKSQFLEWHKKTYGDELIQYPLDEKKICLYMETFFHTPEGNEIPYKDFKTMREKELYYTALKPTIQLGVDLSEKDSTIRYLGQIKKHKLEELKKAPTSELLGFHDFIKALLLVESEMGIEFKIDVDNTIIDDRINLVLATKKAIKNDDLKAYLLDSSSIYESIRFFKNGNIEVLFKNETFAKYFYENYVKEQNNRN